MSSPLVTTVIPTFNRRALLTRSVHSALTQTYRPISVHVLDNASTDDTAATMRELVSNDSRVRYTRHAVNVGALENFRLGLDSVDTEFFSFLADDDYLLPEFYELAVRGLIAHPEAAFWGGRLRWTSPDGSLVSEVPRWNRCGYFQPIEALQPMFTEAFLTWTGIVFRTDAVQSVGGFIPAIGLASDMEMVLRVAAEFPVIVQPNIVAVAETSPHTASGSATHMEAWESWQRVIGALRSTRAGGDGWSVAALEHRMHRAGWLAGLECLRDLNIDDAISVSRNLRATGSRRRGVALSATAYFLRAAPVTLPAVRRVWHVASALSQLIARQTGDRS